MHIFLWLGVLVPVVVAGVGTAMAATAGNLGAREREIDDAVCEDFDRVAKWNLAWTATFATAAVGSAGTAAFAPGDWFVLYLGYGRGAWESAWISFGIGSAVGVTSALTVPGQSWILKRRLDRPSIAVVPTVGRSSTAIAPAGAW
jgi:hypothetical protein